MPPPTDRLSAIEGYKRALLAADKLGLAHDMERELARNDLFYLLVVVLGRRDVGNSDWLYARCREVEAAPNGYLDLWARDHYKSTIITFALTIQDILKNPEITVGIFSFNRPIAKKFLFQIKYELQSNQKLLELFPEILWKEPKREAPKWSEDDGIIVNRKTNPKESTVEAWGLVDGQPTSRHFSLMIYDDVLTRDSVTNPDMIATVTQAWETSRALRTEAGTSRYIGTRWHQNDTYKAIIDRGSAIPRYHYVTKDRTADGEPVFRSREWVAQQRRDMGPFVFGAQMLMDPTADHLQGFREEWLRYYDDSREGAGMNKYLLVDPANSKKRHSDYTAIGVIGLASDNNYYLLDIVRDRLNLKERGDAVFALHRRWKPDSVGYERYGMMADVDYLKERQGQENYRFAIEEVGGTLSKPDRIKRLVPVFEEGRFWLPETCGKADFEGKWHDLVQSFLNDEYRAFPVSSHDDMLDMMSRIFDIPTLWPKAVVKDDRYARRVRQRPRASWQAA